MSTPDPLNYLTLDRTFCILCFADGKRPADASDAILDGVRFNRRGNMTAGQMASHRMSTRSRVLKHLAAYHRALAEHLFPSYTAAYIKRHPVADPATFTV